MGFSYDLKPLAAIKRVSKMPFSKGPAWSAFKIPFEIKSPIAITKRDGCFDMPKFVFYCIWIFPWIMILKTFLKIFGKTRIKLIRVICWLKDINVKETWCVLTGFGCHFKGRWNFRACRVVALSNHRLSSGSLPVFDLRSTTWQPPLFALLEA